VVEMHFLYNYLMMRGGGTGEGEGGREREREQPVVHHPTPWFIVHVKATSYYSSANTLHMQNS